MAAARKGREPRGKRKRRAGEGPAVLVVVTGCVGTGKTRVSEILARRLGMRHVDVGKIVLANRGRLGGGFDSKRKVVVADLLKVRKFLKSGGFLRAGSIVEGHYAHELVGSPAAVIVLRCEPKELDRRLLARGYSEEKRAENILAEVLDTCTIEAEGRFGRRKVFEVETAGKPAGRVASEICGILSKKTARRAGKIDYSGYLG